MQLAPPKGTLLLPFKRNLLGQPSPLRIGVVLGRDHPSRWEGALLEFLKQIPGVDLQTFTFSQRNNPFTKKPSWLLDRLYSVSRSKFDPFGEVSPAAADSIDPESVASLRAARFGVVIWLSGSQNPAISLADVATHGVFTVRFGGGKNAIPFWDEVSNGDITSEAKIYWHDLTFSQGRAVRRVETSTVSGLFVTTNAEQPVIAIMRMLADLCLQVQGDLERFKKQTRELPVENFAQDPPPQVPSTIETASFVARKLIRSAHLRWATRGKRPNWFIALRPNRGNSIANPDAFDPAGFVDVPLPPGVDGIADPFLWDHAGKSYLLFEELAAGHPRGRLGVVEILPDGKFSPMTLILDRPYHLSYPCVAEQDGELYLLPETSEAKRVELYRFKRFPDQLELIATPVEDVPLVDTTPIRIDGTWYLFTTTSEPFMETLLFTANNLEGPWTLHPSGTISTSVRNSRSAGFPFWKNGSLYRPTQDCSVRYGYAITVNKITKLTPTEFEEHPVSCVRPFWQPGLLGTHTWNESAQFQVIDGFRFPK